MQNANPTDMASSPQALMLEFEELNTKYFNEVTKAVNALVDSKVAVHAKQTGYAWLSVESDFEYPVTVRWFGDGQIRYTATVLTRGPVRLPPGRWLEHEVEAGSDSQAIFESEMGIVRVIKMGQADDVSIKKRQVVGQLCCGIAAVVDGIKQNLGRATRVHLLFHSG